MQSDAQQRFELLTFASEDKEFVSRIASVIPTEEERRGEDLEMKGVAILRIVPTLFKLRFRISIFFNPE